MDSKKFTHLVKSEPVFPHTNNGDVAETLSTFDYTTWTVSTQVLVCQVPWDAQYRNVVKFDTEAERKAYFDSLKTSENSYVLTTPQNIFPDGTVRVPLPFDVCANSNYLRVVFPKQPIPYEDAKDPVRTWYFFINSVRQIAPSTSELEISIDYWMTFIDEIKIQYLMLERGHAPLVAAPAPSKYLEAPRSNSKYLLSPDINVGDASQNSFSKLGDFILYAANQQIYAVLAVTTETGSFTEYGTYMQDSMRQPAIYNSNFGEFTSLDYLVLKAEDLFTFLSQIRGKMPYFLEGIVAAYYLPDKLIDLTDVTVKHNWFGIDVWWLKTPEISDTIATLTVDDFGYPTQYKNLTKLYTSPYAQIRLFDEKGSEKTVKIETLTDNKLQLRASMTLAGAAMTASCYLVDVQGASSEIKQRFYESFGRTVPDAGYQFLSQWEIPQFAIFEDQMAKQTYQRYWPKQVNQESTRLAYDNASRSAATAQTNTNASAATSQTNANASASTGYDNAVASANTAQTNSNASAVAARDSAKASAATAQTNTNASASTGYTNSKNSADTSQTNANASAQNSYSTAITNGQASYDNNESQCAASTNAMLIQQQQGWENLAQDIYNMRVMQELDLQSSGTQVMMNSVNSAFNGAVEGAGGGVAGASVGAIGNGIGSAITGSVNYAMTFEKNAQAQYQNAFTALRKGFISLGNTDFKDRYSDLANPTITYPAPSVGGVTVPVFNWQLIPGLKVGDDISVDISSADGSMKALTENSNNTSKEIAGRNNETIKSTSKSSLDTSNANAQRAHDVAVANAGRTQTTSNANSKRAYDTSIANANRSYNVSIANSQRSRDTSVENATRSRDTSIANAGRSYDTSLANAGRSYNTSISNATDSRDTARANFDRETKHLQMQAPIQRGKISSLRQTERPIGLIASLETQSEAAITVEGDQMLRYGYSYGGNWTVTNWNLCDKFTYWRAGDVWLKCVRPGIEDAGSQIESILLQGVTVWRRPQDIGCVSIYDNGF